MSSQTLQTQIEECKSQLKRLLKQHNAQTNERLICRIVADTYKPRERKPKTKKQPMPKPTKNAIVPCSRDQCKSKCRIPRDVYEEGKEYLCTICNEPKRRNYFKQYYHLKKKSETKTSESF